MLMFALTRKSIQHNASTVDPGIIASHIPRHRDFLPPLFLYTLVSCPHGFLTPLFLDTLVSLYRFMT